MGLVEIEGESDKSENGEGSAYDKYSSYNEGKSSLWRGRRLRGRGIT